MAIATITVGMSGSDVRSNINAAIAKANLVDSKADTTALTAEATARAAADTTLTTALAAEVTARTALDGEVEELFTLTGGAARPGDSPANFTTTLSYDDAHDLADIADANIVTGTDGRVAKTTGAGIIAPRGWCRVEPGRHYYVRFAARRATNSPDPSDDAVRFAIAWYDASKAILAAPDAATVVADRANLTTGNGRVQNSAVVSSAAGSTVNVVAPEGTIYAKPYVQTYGADGVTHIEVIEWKDITDNQLWAPSVSSVEARVTSLESLDIGDRLDELEEFLPVLRGWVVKTSAYTAESGDRILANTSSGTFGINLPASPSNGSEVWILDYADTFLFNNLTIGRNGSTINGLAANATLSAVGEYHFIYRDGTWRYS